MLGVPAAGAPLAASPDGAQIAFSPVWEPGSNPQVAVLDVASGAVTSLGAGMAPRWSPDGAAVAFVRARHVWVARPDGSGARQVSTGPGQHFGAAWTPDGRSIAYVSERREGHHPPRIEIVGRDGGGRRVLRDHAISPAFSHDGRLLAFLGVDRAGEATDIRIFELASGKERRLGVLSAGGLAFSPDDSRLAFVSENNNGTGIAVISTGGGGARDLDGACLPPDAPPLLGCSQFGGYSVPFAGATAPFELIVRNQGAQPSEPVRLQITVRDSNGYRVRGARVRLEIVPAAAAAVPVATGTTYFDGYRPFEIALRTRRLARVRFIVSVLGGRNLVARHVYTCRGLHLPPVRGCR
jgi:Tol biopolymer transport system component